MATATKKAEKVESKAKAKSKQPERSRVDLQKLQFKNHELWIKEFDTGNPNVLGQSVVLLRVGNSPRKLCFNVYNSEVKHPDAQGVISQFRQGQDVTDVKGFAQYAVKDLEQERKKLQKRGYARQ